MLHTESGKQYIGSASDIGTRIAVHKHHLNKGTHHSQHLQRAWAKCGPDAFSFETIEHCATESLLVREQYYLDQFRPFGNDGYNASKFANSSRGTKRTPEQIEKMAARFRGKKLSAEHRAKISSAGKGRKHTAETISKMRAARLANNHQIGRPLTGKQKLALHKSGENHPWFGRAHTDESRRKMSLSRTQYAVEQLTDDGGVISIWPSAAEAAAALGLKSADSLWRAVNDSAKKAAGFRWRRCTDRAVVS